MTAHRTGVEIVENSARQIIILGASNVTISLPWLMENLPRGLPGPLDVIAASGHGRSYGARSRVLLRELPGILQSRLWSAIDEYSTLTQKRMALITDIGNDLLYGFSVEQIHGWLTDSINRLQALNAECIMTQLPLASVMKMSSSRYYATRALFFPSSSISWPTLKQRVYELDETVQKLGEQYGIHVIKPQEEWYSLDPIHVRWSKRCRAWTQIVSHWSDWNREVNFRPPRLIQHIQNWNFAAEHRTIAKLALTRRQPVYRDALLSLRLY
ncbi:MAG: SGNH/GDSL hydrolase family protein [Planctomycetota bacterium]|nr:SGNH/GDSL hydrolase family protein [Planctomycetota bacterium]MDA1213098.1 SGNH/GDSL hydrolase family protein [Planctomycetota bacterium]